MDDLILDLFFFVPIVVYVYLIFLGLLLHMVLNLLLLLYDIMDIWAILDYDHHNGHQEDFVNISYDNNGYNSIICILIPFFAFGQYHSMGINISGNLHLALFLFFLLGLTREYALVMLTREYA